jgi:nitrogen fixation NifU-like protein
MDVTTKRIGKMSQDSNEANQGVEATRKMLSCAGFSNTAINYYIEKPHMGSIPNADQISEMTGSCGDTMGVYLKVTDGKIEDVKYEVMGCAGAVSAAMAAVDLIKGKSLEEARALNDGDVFRVLKEIPEKKHHCIQLAVKALHKALDEYRGAKPAPKV